MVTVGTIYAIEVSGRLPTSLAAELDAFDIAERDRSTLLTGEVVDGAALYGLLARFESLGLQLLAIHAVIEPEDSS